MASNLLAMSTEHSVRKRRVSSPLRTYGRNESTRVERPNAALVSIALGGMVARA